MTEVHRLPEQGRLEREASEWIARLTADDVSADDRARFEAWRTAHPAHERVYQELRSTWEEFVAAGPLVRAVSFAQSMNAATSATAGSQSPDGGWRAPRVRWRFAAVAAALAIAAGIAGLRLAGPVKPATSFTTAIGEHATIALPDGSTLELNSGSSARLYYSRTSRVVRLERGEGFFKVAHDPLRPFWVLGDGSWIRAVGTAFNVYLSPAAVEVTVSEGTVRVGSAESLGTRIPSDESLSGGPTAVLTAGEQAKLHGTATATRKLSSADVQRSLTWREGTVYFENQPLSEVVDQLSRYTTLQLTIDDEGLRRLPVGGTFRTSPEGAEALLTMLERGFGVRVRHEGEHVSIDRALAEQ